MAYWDVVDRFPTDSLYKHERIPARQQRVQDTFIKDGLCTIPAAFKALYLVTLCCGHKV